MLEIYNEEYKDLLGKGSAAGSGKAAQQVRHDDRGITTVAGVEAFDVRPPPAFPCLPAHLMLPATSRSQPRCCTCMAQPAAQLA